MKKLILLVCGFAIAASHLSAQENNKQAHRNFPLTVTVQFNALTLPFRDLRTNFSNMGIGLGTEISLNGKQNWVQQFTAGWQRNRYTGNGLFLYTQSAWRPFIFNQFYTEVKAGIGYKYNYRPAPALQPANNGWEKNGYAGKGMLIVPVGISAGYSQYSRSLYLSPFISYQLFLLKSYNKSVPVVPETMLQLGSRIHF
jgi:hypothetical protein